MADNGRDEAREVQRQIDQQRDRAAQLNSRGGVWDGYTPPRIPRKPGKLRRFLDRRETNKRKGKRR